MKSRYLISVAAAALIAGTGFAVAQGAGSGAAPSAAPAAPSAAPAAPSAAAPAAPSSGKATAPAPAPIARGEAPAAPAAKGPEGGKAADGGAMRNNQAQQNVPEGRADRGGPDNDRGVARGDNDRNDRPDRDADRNPQRNNNAASDSDNRRDGARGDPDRARTTTGQAGAGAKLSAEQRTTFRSAATRQNVRPQTNVNFSISIGTRVPRDVRFYPVPTEIVTVYPDWRGYEYFLVGDEIIVVNPRTLEIVAVLDA